MSENSSGAVVKRNLALDGLRGVAIVLVLLFHTNLAGGAALLKAGFLGVELFFVLSGFLITRLLIHEWKRAGRISFLDFYTRRAKRLFPALSVFLLYSWCYALWFAEPGHAEKIKRGVIAALFYYSNWIAAFVSAPFGMLTHTWSLAVEEQFYLIWPLAMTVLLTTLSSFRSRLLVIVLAALASGMLTPLLFITSGSFIRPYAGTDCRMCGLLIGAAVAVIVTHRPVAPSSWILSAAGILAIAVMGRLLTLAAAEDRVWYFGGLHLFSLSAATLIAVLVYQTRGPIVRVFEAPPLQWLGRISYSLYLWHPAVDEVLRVQFKMLPGCGLMLSLWFLSVAIAATSTFLIEARFTRHEGAMSHLWLRQKWELWAKS